MFDNFLHFILTIFTSDKHKYYHTLFFVIRYLPYSIFLSLCLLLLLHLSFMVSKYETNCWALLNLPFNAHSISFKFSEEKFPRYLHMYSIRFCAAQLLLWHLTTKRSILRKTCGRASKNS